MASTVYFCDLRASLRRPFIAKLDDFIQKAGMPGCVVPRRPAALKLHFGEAGNTAFIRPVLVRRFVEAVRAARGIPFLTDANTLYVGSRSDSASHTVNAIENGFAYAVVKAPVVIADGLKGRSDIAVEVDLPECQEAWIGADIVEADALISLAHFKGHELAGFGGAIKNLGMGSASRRGKLFMHSNVAPEVVPKLCIACGLCIQRCPTQAIRLARRGPDDPPDPEKTERIGYRAVKDPQKCIGCGDCILACPTQAMQVAWNAQIPEFLRRMVAYTKGVVASKEKNLLCFNFLTNISPACDCYPFSDAPIVGDIGILASTDPIAIDQASADMVNQAQGFQGSGLEHAHAPGEDKFRDIYPNVDWDIQLAYGEEVGLGSRRYELVKVD